MDTLFPRLSRREPNQCVSGPALIAYWLAKILALDKTDTLLDLVLGQLASKTQLTDLSVRSFPTNKQQISPNLLLPLILRPPGPALHGYCLTSQPVFPTALLATCSDITQPNNQPIPLIQPPEKINTHNSQAPKHDQQLVSVLIARRIIRRKRHDRNPRHEGIGEDISSRHEHLPQLGVLLGNFPAPCLNFISLLSIYRL